MSWEHLVEAYRSAEVFGFILYLVFGLALFITGARMLFETYKQYQADDDYFDREYRIFYRAVLPMIMPIAGFVLVCISVPYLVDGLKAPVTLFISGIHPW